MEIKFNINQYVKVKLTDEGRAIRKKFYSPYVTLSRGLTEDAEGWSKWQLWNLMQVFGPHMRMGPPPPFETEIVILPTGENDRD